MTSKARLAEAERVTDAFHVALTQVGVASLAELLDLWHDTPANAKGAVASGWLDTAVALIFKRRTMSRALGLAYYRLARALITGTTIPDPAHPEPEYVTLQQLRSEFSQLAGKADQDAPEAPVKQEPTRSRAGRDEALQQAPDAADAVSEADDDERIYIEELQRAEAEDAALERAAQQAIEDELKLLGPTNLQNKLDGIDSEQPASQVDKAREDAHTSAGARQAAAGERAAMNGGRSEVWSLADKDKRSLGWARVSLTGTPCGWCAMLISRGVVYKSEASASFKADSDSYHDNCHCVAVPVFSDEQYEQSGRFDLNRLYAKQWPQVTQGLSGKAAVSAWRRFIRQQSKVGQEPASPIAQEA